MHRSITFHSLSVLCLLTFALTACKSATTPVGETPTPTETTSPNPTATPTPAPVVYQEARTILHVHSAYSHDACDGEGITNGVVNAECITDLREAACAAGLDFVALTDHPSFMSDYSMTEVLLFDQAAGDVLVEGADGPFANVTTCADGHQVTYLAGYEGSPHLMPLGIRDPLPPELYEGIENSIPMGEVQATVSGLKSHGAFVAVAHSEEDDLSGTRILDADIDGMEWYNPHGNFTALIDFQSGDPAELIDRLGSIQSFLLGANDPANADLVYLVLLQSFPTPGLDKWREVQNERAVVGLMGSDVHQNVSIDPICTPDLMPLCQLAAAAYPHVLTSLIAGGEITLTDGDRIDSYARVLRWVENRVLVVEPTPDELYDALANGRTYGVFTVFGDPSGFDVRAVNADGWPSPIGSVVDDAEAIEITNPVPVQMGGAPFTAGEAAKALVTSRLMRVAPGGPVLVATNSEQGATWSHPLTEPGSYYVEVWIEPQHLLVPLGPETTLADAEYLWAITNPIRVK